MNCYCMAGFYFSFWVMLKQCCKDTVFRSILLGYCWNSNPNQCFRDVIFRQQFFILSLWHVLGWISKSLPHRKKLVSNTLCDSIITRYSMKIHFKKTLRIHACTGPVDMWILKSCSPTAREQVGTALPKTYSNLFITVTQSVKAGVSGRLNSTGSEDQLTE